MTEDRRKTDAKESPNQRMTLIICAFIALGGCVGAFVFVMLFGTASDRADAGTLNLFLGMIATGLISIIKDASGFNFGSSTSNAAKDAMVAKTLDTASTVANTASTVANTAAGTGTGATPTP